MATKRLANILTSPSKVASALDWKRMTGATILNLDIHQDSIEMAVASHPSQCNRSGSTVHRLPSIPLEPESPHGHKSMIPDASWFQDAQEKLAEIVRQYHVCGFVVSWPLQPDTGNPGAACGRTLHTLDELLKLQEEPTTNNDSSKKEIFTSSRPVCLWDGVHAPQPPTDGWGRNVNYARTSPKTECRATQERYHADANIVATEVWRDFVKTHWAEIDQQCGSDEDEDSLWLVEDQEPSDTNRLLEASQ